jgi:hypothetical protein
MAEIDWRGFADAVSDRLDRERFSVRGAVARWPETNVTLWSRARRGQQPLSAENYLLVCRVLDIQPWRFWRAEPRPPRRKVPRIAIRAILKNMRKQAVAAPVSREEGASR